VTESGSPGSLKKLDARGAVIATVTVGNSPFFPIYDGTNIWVPNNDSNSVSVVRPTDGLVLATLTGNGLNGPISAAFDGQRVLVTNNSDNSVSLFWAADFSPLGTFSTGDLSQPCGACSDGLNFWIALRGGALARF
jgi:DNA-binding beta-propeller fold protein YncE